MIHRRRSTSGEKAILKIALARPHNLPENRQAAAALAADRYCKIQNREEWRRDRRREHARRKLISARLKKHLAVRDTLDAAVGFVNDLQTQTFIPSAPSLRKPKPA